MPSNYVSTQDTTSAPSLVADKPIQDVSGNIQAAGQAVASLAGLFKGKNDDRQLGEFSTKLADIENAAIQYNIDRADIQRQILTADDRVRSELQAKLASIEAGKVSGSLPPQYARILTNKLIKDYSTDYPSLSKDVRAMANTAMDNLSEVNREVFGENPQNKVITGLIEESYKTGVSVPELVHRAKVKGIQEATLAELQVLQQTNALDNSRLTSEVTRMSFSDAQVRVGYLAKDWADRLKAGEMLTDVDAVREVGVIKDEYMRAYMQMLVDNGLPGLTPEAMKSALEPAFSLMDNMQKVLSSTGTLDQKLALLKNESALLAARKEIDAATALSALGGPWKWLTPADSTKAFAAAATILQNREFKDLNSPEWDAAAQAAIANGDITFQVGLNFIRTPKGQEFVAENLGQYMAGANTGAPEDPATHAVTTRALNDVLRQLAGSPEEQRKYASNAMPRFTWKDLVHNPELARVTAADPQLSQEAMRKAANWTKWFLETKGIQPEDLVVDHSKLGSTFTIKGQKPMAERPNYQQQNQAAADPQVQLNKTYMQIINTYGAAGVDMWLEQLGLDQIAKKQKQATTPDKKKVSNSAEAYKKPTKYDDLISQSAEKAGVDPLIFKVLLGTESSFMPDAVSPRGKDFGLGIGQISAAHGLSDEQRLDPNVAIPKAANIFAQYLRDSNGDYREAMMKYKGAISQKGRDSMAPIIDSILAVSSG